MNNRTTQDDNQTPPHSKKKQNIIITAIVLTVFIIVIAILYFIPASEPLVGQTKYIAHRGLSSRYYENTYDAFKYAGSSSFFYGIETDIYRTGDGHFVCAHDMTPFEDKTIRIEDNTLENLLKIPLDKTLTIGKYAEYSDDLRLCTYEDYLNICINYNKKPIIELKAELSLEHIAEFVSFTEQICSIQDVFVISFVENNVQALLNLNSNIPVMLLMSSVKPRTSVFKTNYHIGIHKSLTTKFYVKKAHKASKLVNVWTVNNKSDAQKYVKMGVDFITTDYDFDKE